MTVARSQLVDIDTTRFYHCISRCVRRANLCGEGYEHRKQWIEDRLQTLAGSFAISVCGFSVMDNHLHVLVRLDPDRAKSWSDEQVVRLWMAVYPPPKVDRDDPKIVQSWVNHQVKDKKLVIRLRKRLCDLGWFMKALKEPLARMANKEDDCKGTFWESRYKSIAILDQEALLATCAYIDLNPLAAGLASTPEGSKYTSLRQRIGHVKRLGKLGALKESAKGSIAGVRALGSVEQSHWLCPLEDASGKGGTREGMVENFSLGSYLLLVDYTSRLCRTGKARVSREEAGVFERLGTSAEFWSDRLKALFATSRLFGSYFATDRSRLQAVGERRGVHHVDNAVRLVAAG